MKYALMSYDYTTNIRNEIPSIAARQFLPEIDYYINHEKLNDFKPDLDEKILQNDLNGNKIKPNTNKKSFKKPKMMMNGGYLDSAKSWPPNDDIEPLLISMHFDAMLTLDKNKLKAILSDESREYLNKYGPVGCRYTTTMEFLRKMILKHIIQTNLNLG